MGQGHRIKPVFFFASLIADEGVGVPMESRTRNSSRRWSIDAEKDVDGELVEPFVFQAFSSKSRAIEVVGEQCIETSERAIRVGRLDLRQNILDLFVIVPAFRFVFKYQIGTHTAPGEILHTVVILSAVGVSIEMT
jgi:hypothetical protein